MRQIKFRIYNKLLKVWHYFVMDQRGARFVDLSNQGENVLHVAGGRRVIGKWLQYTDLKDIVGKEIYEGDIVRTNDNQLGEIIFERGAFYIRNKAGILRTDKWWFDDPGMNLKVVGNIYENQKILNGK